MPSHTASVVLLSCRQDGAVYSSDEERERERVKAEQQSAAHNAAVAEVKEALRKRKELDPTVVPDVFERFPDIVLWGQLRGGIRISKDRMTAVARYPTMHLRFDMVLSGMPLQPTDPSRQFEKNTWLVKVNHCPTRQVFVGVTTSPENAIGTMNIARVCASPLKMLTPRWCLSRRLPRG